MAPKCCFRNQHETANSLCLRKFAITLTRGKAMDMKQKFYVSICQENEWFVAQALAIDVASQGATVEESLDNLREALELHFEPPTAVAYPQIREVEVEVTAS